MNTYQAFLSEEYGLLAEKLITFAGQAYPKFGNVIIMAGGAGSGKGFVKDKLVGAEGFTFDVDALKTMASKTPAILAKVKAERGIDMAELASDLKNPANVSKLHEIIGGYLNLDNKKLNAIYTSIITAAPDRKPNLIFDVTLKDLHKFDNLTRQVRELGYSNDRIHIVWVVNDIEVAKAQNEKRDRTVPVEILINTHRGVSSTMHDIFNMGKQLKKYMDGDLVIAFNKVGVDSEVVAGEKKDNVAFSNRKASSAMYVKAANYFYLKRAGKDIIPFDDIQKDIRAKIASYVPAGVVWEEFELNGETLEEGAGKIAVKAVKLDKVKIPVKGGYTLFTGWTVRRTDNGEFYTINGETPWNPNGGEQSAKEVEASGLLPNAKFVKLANAPKLVKEAVEELDEGVGNYEVVSYSGGGLSGYAIRNKSDKFYSKDGTKPVVIGKKDALALASTMDDKAKFVDRKWFVKEGVETDDTLDEGYFKMHPDDQYSYTVWKKDLHTGKLSHKEHLDNSSELEDWMQKALGKHATVLVKQDQTGKEITYTDNGRKFEIIDKKK